MTNSLSLSNFLSLSGVILDVRSPGEYSQGRIPGAVNLPLFTNEERAAVGATYKQVGKREAIELGLKFVGPKLADFAATARTHVKEGAAKVHCWRGGMRSSSMAWLLGVAGLESATLVGGYKTFRRWAIESLCLPRRLHVIGGLTGSGKTSILQILRKTGRQTLDLEALACHRGSSYGMLGMPPQPTSEQFENEIAMQWSSFDPNLPVWVEDESRAIGKCRIPDALFSQMEAAPLFLIERPLEERLQILYDEYGHIDRQELIQASLRLVKQLGMTRAREVVEFINLGRLREAMQIMLGYYDAAYRHSLSRRQRCIKPLQANGLSDAEWATLLGSDPTL